MKLLLLTLHTALAKGPEVRQYPQQVPVSCPASGLCRIEVPAAFVADNPDSWLLADRDGQPVPYAVLRDAPTLGWQVTRLRALREPDAVTVLRPPGQPVSAVRVQFLTVPFQAAARIETRRSGDPGWTPGPWTLIAGGLGDDEPAVFWVPDPSADEIRIHFDRPWPTLPATAWSELALRPPEALAPARVPMTVSASGVSEGESSVFELSLPGPARVLAIDVDASDDVFRRPVSVLTWEMEGEALVPREQVAGELQRVAIGETRVDHTRLEGLDLVMQRAALRVRDDLDAPLNITRATATVARRVLLVRDGGELTLYGASVEARLSYDLQEAAAELARAPSTDATLGEVVPNPAWVGVEQDIKLQPGALADRGRFLYGRAVIASGLARVPVPPDVLAATRSDLSDLRLLDASDRQIPYLVERGLLPQRVEGVVETRADEGSTTRIGLALPTPDLPLRSLTLRSPDSGFERSVTVFSSEGGQHQIVRKALWRASDRGPAMLTLGLDGPVDSGLTVEIDHGDNRPIRVDPVELRAAQVSVLARIPAGGATLVYGDRSRAVSQGSGLFRRLRRPGWAEALEAPRYDAARLAERLRRAPAAEADLGPVQALGPATQTATDKLAVSVGLGVLVVGLLALMASMLRGLRADRL